MVAVETSHDHLASLLSEWREVATFFMLRLLLAPCVETVLMLDRVLYLREKGVYASYNIMCCVVLDCVRACVCVVCRL